MAQTPEQRVAAAIAKHFDSMSLNNRMAAAFAIEEMGPEQQDKFFDFILHCISIFADDPMNGYVGMARANRNLISIAIKEAMEKEGYFLA